MKVDIITCHTPFNYGAVLQCYALSSYLADRGFPVEVIDYVTPAIKQKNLLFAIGRGVVRFFDFRRCRRVFGNFLHSYIPLTATKYRSFHELAQNPPPADTYIAGSDQIWNGRLQNGRDDSFYLSFAPKGKKRIAYAASLAMEAFPEGMEEYYRERLSRFDHISVREQSSVALLGELGIEDVRHVLDPVYLCSPAEWEAFSDGFQPREPYLLLYCFSRSPEYYDYAKRLARERKLKLYIISNLLSDRRFVHDRFFWTPSPERFLSLIRHAECVVTNSFHGLSFSILFEKELHVFESLQGSVRIRDTLRLFRQESRLIRDGGKALLPPECDYRFARAQKESLSVKSQEFLLSALA